MKAAKRLICILLSAASLLLFAACSGDANDTVVAKVNGENVYKWQVLNLYNQNKSYYTSIAGVDLEDSKNRQQKQAYLKELLDQAINSMVVYVSAKAEGYDLTAEERKTAVDDDYASFMERNVKFYADNNFKGDPKAQEKAKKKFDQTLKDANLNEERIKFALYLNAVSKKLTSKLTESVKVDETKMKDLYNQRVAEQKEKYTKDPSSFAADAVTPQSMVFYSPPGFVRVKHILIGYPDELKSQIDKLLKEMNDTALKQIQAMQQNGENDKVAGDLFKRVEELQKQIDELRKQGHEQIKAKADEVLAKVKDGVNFDMLIDEYGADPGMTQYPAKQYGYLLSKDSEYVESFKNASLALQNDGDTTDLVESEYGYHIIKLVEKIPEGATPYEKCEKLLRDVLTAPDIQKIVSEYVEKQKATMKIEKFENRL